MRITSQRRSFVDHETDMKQGDVTEKHRDHMGFILGGALRSL